VINHKDCGAAKIANGKKEFNVTNEKKIHEDSFSN
jgi:carbonic anhydrase